MATEKNISSRIINKHDTEVNWNKATNFTPKVGEIIVYDRDETYNYERFKIGDGVTAVANLPFSSVQSDWNQNDETALDYVKNRTHWEENNTITLEWDGDWQKDGLVTVTLDFGSPYYNYVKISDLTPSFEELYESGELVMHFDAGDEESSRSFASYAGEDLIQQDTGWLTESIVVAYVDGCTFSANDVTLALPEAGIYFCHFVNGSGSFYISSLSWDTETIHTIDPKYIPSSIQRTITGTPGQVVGFDADGNAIAQEAPSSLPDFDSSNEGQILVVKDSIPTWDNNKTTKLAVTDDGVLYLASI